MLVCKYCGKECKNANSLRNHERLCSYNPNKQISNLIEHNKKVKEGIIFIWNKGLTKETDERVRNNAERVHESYLTGKSIQWEKGLTKETDERIRKQAEQISKTCLKKSKQGTWHKSLAKNMHYNYKGIDLDGTWELEYAKYLDANNIEWKRPNERFEYIFENKLRHYTPDFYIVHEDTFVEIKGYKTKKDDEKWKQFPKDKRLKVLFKKDLIKIGII